MSVYIYINIFKYIDKYIYIYISICARVHEGYKSLHRRVIATCYHLVVQVNSLCGPNLGVAETVSRLAASAPVSGQIYMLKIPRVASTACAGSSGTVVSHQEITQVVNMVQVVAPCNNHRSAGKQRPGTIAPFNVLAIRYVAVAGQVLSHPLPNSCVSDSI